MKKVVTIMWDFASLQTVSAAGKAFARTALNMETFQSSKCESAALTTW